MLPFDSPWPPPSKDSFVATALLQACSQGILFAQGNTYFERFKDDRLLTRIYIAAILVVSVFQTCLVIVSDSKVTTGLDRSWVAWCEPLVNILTACMVQPLLIWRCWKVTTSLPVPILLGAVFLVAKILAVMQVVINCCHRLSDSPEMIRLAHILLIASIFAAIALDTFITAILLRYFRRSRTGVEQVDVTLNKLVALTWECAAPPAISLLVAAIVLLATSSMSVPRVFLICTGKLYCHAILRTFNSRARLREGFATHTNVLGRISLHDLHLRRESGGVDPGYTFPGPSDRVSPVNTIHTVNRRDKGDGLSFKSCTSSGLRDYYRRQHQRRSSPERSREIQTLLEALRNTSPSEAPRSSQDKFTSIPDPALLMKGRASSGLRFHSESTAVEPDFDIAGSSTKRRPMTLITPIEENIRRMNSVFWERWNELEMARISNEEYRRHGRTHRLGSFPLSPPPLRRAFVRGRPPPIIPPARATHNDQPQAPLGQPIYNVTPPIHEPDAHPEESRPTILTRWTA